jgi:hypothetical protein
MKIKLLWFFLFTNVYTELIGISSDFICFHEIYVNYTQEISLLKIRRN